MRTITVIPGLTVDEDMYQRVEAVLPRFAPGVGLTWDQFTTPDSWLLIPDERCFGYKAELVLLRTTEATVKTNLWMGPDLRSGETPKPHNHPWEFTSHILRGGYAESRYENRGTRIVAGTVSHGEGGANEVPLSTFHEVTEIYESGATLTLMVCGPGVKGDWGYLDPYTGNFVPVPPDPDFKLRLTQLNPRLR